MLNRIRALAASAPQADPSSPAAADQGTYVSWRPDLGCAQLVEQWCRDHGIDDPVEANRMHVTIMYSKVNGLDPKKWGDRKLSPLVVVPVDTPRTIERFGPDHQALVVRFGTFPAAWLRHAELTEMGLQHTYPEAHLNFHMTLSYTAGQVAPDVMASIARNPLPFPLVFDREIIKAAEA